MRRHSITIVLALVTAGALPMKGPVVAKAATAGTPLLSEDFSAAALDPNRWYVPKYVAAGDGTFIGRTQMRVSQDTPLPTPSGGTVCLPIESHNPKGFSFYGSEIISKQAFAVGAGLDITVRARMQSGKHGGLVGGIFLYALNQGSDTLHDEIDFELLTNAPDKVQTNIYGNEPLGLGHVEMVPYKSGTVADEHTYEVRWTPKEVSWLLDGQVVRTTTANIPARPMSLYLNIWAPDQYWPQGFSAAIQPVSTKEANSVLDALCVRSVTVRPLQP